MPQRSRVHYCLAIGAFGQPRSIRTDNEAMFTGKLWRNATVLFGIQALRSQPGYPWQNGRIERFFGTLNPTIRTLRPASAAVLQHVLDAFVVSYNVLRPHQAFGGLTPAETWCGETWIDVLRPAPRRQWASAFEQHLAQRERC